MLAPPGDHDWGKIMSRILWVVLAAGLALCEFTHAADKPFSGSFKANGADAKLEHLIAVKDTLFDDRPATMLIFSEKSASSDAKAKDDALFGKLGDALIVRVVRDGEKWDTMGGNLVHASLKHSGVSASGIFRLSDAKLANGELSGHLTTKPGEDIFGEPISIDLTFHVKQP